MNGSSRGAIVGEIAMILPVLVLPKPSEIPRKCKEPSAGFASEIIQLFSYWPTQPNCESITPGENSSKSVAYKDVMISLNVLLVLFTSAALFVDSEKPEKLLEASPWAFIKLLVVATLASKSGVEASSILML